MSAVQKAIDQTYVLRDVHAAVLRVKDQRISQLEKDNDRLERRNSSYTKLIESIRDIIKQDPDCNCSAWAVNCIEALLPDDLSDEQENYRLALEDIQRIVDDEYVFDAGLALDAIETRVQKALATSFDAV
jgi:hypothetical protein